MKPLQFISFFFLAYLIFFESCKNSGRPAYPDYKSINAYVIGKEACYSDNTKDYWLVDFNYDPNTSQYGDTIILNGITYTNVVKTKDLASWAKRIGEKLSIDFKTISTNKVQSSGCNLLPSQTYILKELFIIHQFEIR